MMLPVRKNLEQKENQGNKGKEDRMINHEKHEMTRKKATAGRSYF